MTRINRLQQRHQAWWQLLLTSSFLLLASSFTPPANYRTEKIQLASSVSTSEGTTIEPTLKGANSAVETIQEESKEGGQKKQQRKREPWRANFFVSKKTQQKIQQAAVDRGNARRSAGQRATAVLNALLSTQPEKCNAANLVCALTLSAKVLGPQGRPNENFRSLLFEALEILDKLVERKNLNSRQYCNAIWAVAKHYDRDPLLLPAAQSSVLAHEYGAAETWDLSESEDVDHAISREERLEGTIQGIANELTAMLANEVANTTEAVNAYSGQKPKANRDTKLGEICMASWAFGVLRPRQTPPGWLEPPQMGKVSKSNQQQQPPAKRTNDFMSFEQWTMNDEDLSFLQQNDADEDGKEKNAPPKDPVDALFDAIGEALCRPINGEELINSSMFEPEYEFMRITDCTWSEIANLAWAFEKRGRCLSEESETLLRALSREAAWRLRTAGDETKYMLSRDISQLIWALGTLQQDNFRLAHDLVELVDDFSELMGFRGGAEDRRPFQKWSCPDIVQMISSLSHARIDDSRLLLALFQEANMRLDKGIYSQPRRQDGRKVFLSWEVCVMLWAQARLHLTSSKGRGYGEFPQRAAACINSAASEGSLLDIGIGPQEQANLAWSLTVLQQHQSDEAIELLRGVFHDAANTCEEEGVIQLEHAHQLWQALFLLEEESPGAVSRVPKWFRDYLSDKWNLEKSTKKISSARHKSISDVLNLMGIAHFNEHDEDIDVAIVLKHQASWAHQTENTGNGGDSMKVAVEFDGPNHFTRKRIPRDDQSPAEPVRALGHTVLKYRLLKQKGWTCVRIPFYEFDKIPFWASMERQRYLQRVLKTHANIRFSDVDISEYQKMTASRKTRFD